MKQQFRHISLTTLLSDWFDVPESAERQITGLSIDSRRLLRGEIFIALSGEKANGQQFIDDAIRYGAAAVLCDAEQPGLQWYKQIPIFSIVKLQQIYGVIAAKFYDHPSEQLTIIGVTGTNGKTSTTHFIAQSLQALGHRCGIIGTLGCGDIKQLQFSARTTPDAISIQRYLFEMYNAGFTHVAMEVSSHALAQYRVNGVQFNIAVLSNLSHEHLDYHGDMANYAASKKRLFQQFRLDYAVINADDDYGCQWLSEFWGNLHTYAYSTDSCRAKPLVEDGHIPLMQAKQVAFSAHGINAVIVSPWGTGHLQSSQVGQFNLSNLLATATVLCLLGERLDNILSQFQHIQQVKGRMQTFVVKDQPLVVVDYAHTPDALEKVLMALSQHQHQRLHCVFGCGGVRDKTKRPLMGKIAEQYADTVILTDDNVRNENPKAIIDDILSGIEQPERIHVEHDRAKAIAHAIIHANHGDIVLIAGKGHEDYQEINDQRMYFSDIEEVQQCLAINTLK